MALKEIDPVSLHMALKEIDPVGLHMQSGIHAQEILNLKLHHISKNPS